MINGASTLKCLEGNKYVSKQKQMLNLTGQFKDEVDPARVEVR